MMQVYHFGTAGKVPDASPFCVKLLTYIKMAGIEFETIRGSHNLNKSPKGKMPFIDHNGKKIGDSTLIIEYLKETFGDKVDEHLTEEQRHQGLFLQRTFEDHLYWVMVWSRWADDQQFQLSKETFFKRLSFPLSVIVPPIARKRAVKMLQAQGTGRHDRETVYEMGVQDLRALVPQFKADQFLFGEKPSSFDAVAYGCFANILWMPHEQPLKAFLRQQPHIEAYCERIHQMYWPELKG